MDRQWGLGGLLIVAAAAAQAGTGLVAPSAEQLWPQWQARVTVQTAGLSPLATAQWLDGGAAPATRGVQGGAIFGDYVFARPSFGSFRASGGLLVGSQGGLPLGSFSAGQRVGVALNGSPAAAGNPDSTTLPYLGLGYSGSPWRGALAITADVGMVAERPGGGLGRALLGNQGLDGTLREIRLSPLLQLGVRYTF